MLSIQKHERNSLKYFDTQTVSTENDVYHCLRTQLSILIMQIQEWLSGSFDIKDVYGCIGTDLLLHGVFISQLIRYDRACSSYECFILNAVRL